MAESFSQFDKISVDAFYNSEGIRPYLARGCMRCCFVLMSPL